MSQRVGRPGGRKPCRRPATPGIGRLERARRRLAERGDEGFSLIETVVSMALVAIVMTAATTFFVNVLQASSYMRGKQAAVQLADDGLEQARAYEVKSIASGRDWASSNAQWSTATNQAVTNPGYIAAAVPYLNSTQMYWDKTNSNDGTTCSNTPATNDPACLSTVGQVSLINGISYTVNTFVGVCARLSGSTNCTKTTPTAPGAATPYYGSSPLTTGDPAPQEGSNAANIIFFRVIVAVTWTNKVCTRGCSFVSDELLNGSSDPIFNLNNGSLIGATTNASLALTNPGSQTTTTGVPVNLQMLYSGGTGQVTWTGLQLPLGLSIDTSSGTIYGTPTCLVSPCAVSVKGVDATGASSTINFTWTVKPVPNVSNPADGATITSPNGIAISPLTVGATDGTTPYTWTVTGLPTGLSFSGTNITGTPTTSGTFTTVVKVVDNNGKSDTSTVTWVIVSNIVDPGGQVVKVGTAVSLALVQHGETNPTWTATGLPQGVTINSTTGKITGTPTLIQNTTSVIKADDGTGAAPTVSIDWTVSGRIAAYGDLAGDCLDVANSSITDNTAVVAYTCGTGVNQVWTNPADGTIRTTLSGSTVRCLTAASFANNAGVVSRPCGNSSQTWSLKYVGSLGTVSYYQIQMVGGVLNLTTYCLGKTGSATTNGQQMALVSCSSSASSRTYWGMGG